MREFFEPRFGHDFSSVRIHADASAAGVARKLGAEAFTQGSDIYFAGGRFEPRSVPTYRLLAHELVHVIQQQGASSASRRVQRAPDTSAVESDVAPSNVPSAKKPEGNDPPKSGTPLSQGISLDLDMNGGLTSKELHVAINSNRSNIQLTFRHDAGKRTRSVTIAPKRIQAKDAIFMGAGTTDGIHPLEIYVAGISPEDQATAVLDTIFVAPGGAPGKYAVMEGKEFDPSAAQLVDLGVDADFGEAGERIIEQSGELKKEGGTYQINFRVGPKLEIVAALYIVKDPDDEDAVLCYFEMAAPGPGKMGIQTPPSQSMKVALPVTYEELDIEKYGESNSSLTYRFLPPGYARGILVTYEMNPLDAASPGAANALHGLNVYPVDTDTGRPDKNVPAAKARFMQAGGVWRIGSERRTVESFRIESAKDALEKLPQIKTPKNELAALTGQMSLLAMTAVKEGISSRALFERWVELSYGVAVYGPEATAGDETAKLWLTERANQFLQTLQDDIGSAGTSKDVNASGVGPGGGRTTTTFKNKYTGASQLEESFVGAGMPKEKKKIDLAKPFEDVRASFAASKYDEAIAKLRGSYYLWVEDQLLTNRSTDKETKSRLQSYGQQMSYRRQLRETLGGQTRPTQKVRALYYPDMTNVTGQNKYERKYAGVDKIVSLPLDIYYEDADSEWILYNFTTLAEPGKLNDFKRTRSKAPGEFAPPQEMFDLLTSDQGVGTGYIHYQTETGEGGIVRVDHPWTVGGVLLTAAAVAGLIALALTGVGLLFEGAAVAGVTATSAAAVLGDVAMITALAGGTIKLVSDISEGAPVGAGQVAGLALDVATAVIPVIRSLRTVASLRRYKQMFILLDTAASARWAAKLELAANTTAIVVGTGKGVEELIALSNALEEGKIDEATFYWAVVRNVGLGVINVVLLRSGVEAASGRSIGNTTIDEVVQKSLSRGLLDTKPTAMHTAETLESGIEIMQESSSVYRAMVLEALSEESKFEKAVDVLCYLGKKSQDKNISPTRGAMDDVVILDGRVRRAVDVLVEGKFYGKTLPIPQGFTGSKAEALDEISRDFAAFSKAAADGVHNLPGLANAEVRMQGSATMGIVRPKRPAGEVEAGKPADAQLRTGPQPSDEAWDVDLAVMLEPADFEKRLVDTFKGKVKFTDETKGPIEIEKMSHEDIVELANTIIREDVARATAREAAEAKGEKLPDRTYNSAASTFANAIVTGKANPGSQWSKDLAKLRDQLVNEFHLPKLDLSVLEKGSGFDSSPFIVLK